MIHSRRGFAVPVGLVDPKTVRGCAASCETQPRRDKDYNKGRKMSKSKRVNNLSAAGNVGRTRRNHKPKTLSETLEGLLTLQSWQTQMLELAVLQARHIETLARDAEQRQATDKGTPS